MFNYDPMFACIVYVDHAECCLYLYISDHRLYIPFLSIYYCDTINYELVKIVVLQLYDVG